MNRKITETYHCPPNVDCPCYSKMWEEIDRLRTQDDAIRAEFGGKRDGRPTIECLREAFDAKWSEEDELFKAALNLGMKELRAMVVKAARLVADNERLRGALTPSVDTKAAYIGEFSFFYTYPGEDGEEVPMKVTVPWTTIKEIMAAIKTRAALQDKSDEAAETQWPHGFFPITRTIDQHCASRGCGQAVSVRVEIGNVWWVYCEPCAREIAALQDKSDEPSEGKAAIEGAHEASKP